MTRSIGIDLGTSNSAIAIIDSDGTAKILSTFYGNQMMPSVVWFSERGAVVGEPALRGFEEDPDLTIFGVKRLLGKRYDHPEVRRLAKVLPYELIPASNGDVHIALDGGRTVSPQEVSALILMELREIASAHVTGPITDAVITVPAWFDAPARQATKDAAVIAGFNVRRLLSEPSAAALGYRAHLRGKRKLAVCDFGGGTFDVALVDVEQSVFEVLATTGDAFLGGDDIDRLMVEQLAKDIKRNRGYDISAEPAAVDRLRVAAQNAKHHLSSHDNAAVAIEQLTTLPSGRAVEYSRTISRSELEQWCEPVLRRLAPPVHQALMRASRRVDQVDEVLLVGGMTKMQAVQEEFAKVFGRDPLVVENPHEVVALGAAYEIARLDGIVDDVLLIDVCARGIAISIQDGFCEPIIAVNSVIPTREFRALMTRSDSQTKIEFDLWEGESTDANDNRLLGRYATPELPLAAAGDVIVVLEVTIDSDGTLRLAATELISGERLTIEPLMQSGLARSEVVRLANAFRAEQDVLH